MVNRFRLVGISLVVLLVACAAFIGSCHSGSGGGQVLTAATQLRGDLDDNGNPSVNDAIGILRIVVGLAGPNQVADADGDGGTSVNDAIAVLRCVVGLAQWPLGEYTFEPTRTIGPGVVAETEFVVGAEENVECLGDTTIQCDTATIAGELFTRSATVAGGDGPDIIIEAQGDIVVTGAVNAGKGAAGADESDGGDGGNITLRSAAGDITLGAEAGAGAVTPQAAVTPGLHAGDGADGGDGETGGAGGAGGTVTLDCANATLTVHQAPGLLHVGNGGDGGDAVILGDAMAEYDPPDEPPNNGGGSGYVVISFETLQGAELHNVPAPEPDEPAAAVVLEDGVGSGGVGGDGGHAQFGEAIVETGIGRHDVAPSAVDITTITEQPAPVRGGDGGDGVCKGGNGGNASQLFGAGDNPGAAGSDGWDAAATGGDGGSVKDALIDWDNRESCNLGGSLDGGHGGHAIASGGWGANGAPDGGNGGHGGDAQADGGDGGHVVKWGPVMNAGVGGNARATGGWGGTGGDNCTPPPREGGAGGNGGDARANGGSGDTSPKAKGGDATALGGNGGMGGNGAPPGTGGGGAPGIAFHGFGDPWGSQTAIDGVVGPAGGACPEPVKRNITGRVTDLLDRPIIDLPISWSTWVTTSSAGVGALDDDHGSVQTGADGVFEISDLADGTYWVEPETAQTLPSFWNPPMRMVTVAGADVPDQDFRIATATRTYSITINVHTVGGAPVAGETVMLIKQGEPALTQPTNAAGDATFTGLWPGVYNGLPPNSSAYSYNPFQLVFALADQNLRQEYEVTPK